LRPQFFKAGFPEKVNKMREVCWRWRPVVMLLEMVFMKKLNVLHGKGYRLKIRHPYRVGGQINTSRCIII
jgi:hypothetical protein